ncbi:hypothetical protein CDL15_Pgr027169 [Punica granatum]|uniref:Uncharacterized protein n=1 Tax=Punica granatum TaxID=22663 RepID=A0A218XBT5_PUNGR|nr:hypothetical protein CDL15_Pgr027169 [Punica granatum]
MVLAATHRLLSAQSPDVIMLATWNAAHSLFLNQSGTANIITITILSTPSRQRKVDFQMGTTAMPANCTETPSTLLMSARNATSQLMSVAPSRRFHFFPSQIMVLPSLVEKYENDRIARGDSLDAFPHYFEAEVLRLRKQKEEKEAEREAKRQQIKALEDELAQYEASKLIE